MKQFLLWLLFCVAPLGAAQAALSIDGSATASTVGVALTTTSSNDVIVAFIDCTASTTTCSVNGVSNTSGLTWTKRIGNTQTLNTYEEWYAIAPTPLTADTITASYTGAASQRIYVFGVSGANTTTPFDGNGSIPSTSTDTTGKTLTQTVSTTSSNTMLLATVRSTATLATITEPTGFTSPLSAGANQDFSYKVVASPQSSLAVTYSWTGATTRSIMIADAIQAAGGVAPSKGVLMNSGF